MAKQIINKADLKGFVLKYSITSQGNINGSKSLNVVADTTTNKVHYEITENGNIKPGASTLDMAIDLYNKL
jgi:hypothetical protein